jgi:universal stress protein C
MPYSHLLVAVAPTPESRVLIQKAVSIARPVNAKVSLITWPRTRSCITSLRRR